MVSKLNITLSVFILLLLVTCTKEDEVFREYPRLKTLPVVDISEEGATFSAQILELGNQDIIEYGFVWGETENLSIENSERKNYFFKP
ncbi:MAG: hypothetical protein RLO12_13715 [Fulvivirga sp.]